MTALQERRQTVGFLEKHCQVNLLSHGQPRRHSGRAIQRYTEGDGIGSDNHLPRSGMRDTTPIEDPFEADTAPNRGIPLAVMVDSGGTLLTPLS